MTVSPEPARLVNTRRFLTHCSLGQFDGMEKLLSPDATYRVPGQHVLSGEHHGPDQIMRYLRRVLTITRDTLEVLKWEDWMVGEYHVTALVYLHAQGHGRIYEGRQLFLVTCDANDLICEIRI